MTDLRLSVIICAYTLDRWDQLVEAVASVHAQSTPAAEVVVVVDHNDELLERAGQTLAGGGHGCCPTPSAAAWPVRATPVSRRRTGTWWCSWTTTPRRDPALARGDVRHYARPGRPRRRRAGRAAVGRRCPGLVPARVRLGGRLLLHRPARRTSAGPQPDRRQHVLPPGRRRWRWAASGVEVGRVGAGALGCEETELPIRLAQRLPRHADPARAGRRSCTTTCPADRGRGPTSAGAAGPRGVSKAPGAPARASPGRRSAANAPTSAGRSRSAWPATSTPRSPPATRRARPGRGHRVRARPHRRWLRHRHRTHPPRHTTNEPENTMQGTQMPASGWLQLRRPRQARHPGRGRTPPAPPQLRAMLACFATDAGGAGRHRRVREKPEPMPDAALLEDELAYTETACGSSSDAGAGRAGRGAGTASTAPASC